ncbi:putative serine/threonine kinase [Gloeothece citriformis PCC 7424]|uniref:Putative serine/threonine kinase n=1 Tax=Gloeothece citriformis (strain PCC 7424) TaxID=65393 RepID=B7KAW2_GLOC7|nr:substrate-binding domain-containing protein [Gloeothece citriformis]ACK70072.1 putative serine/threonine kinase [Gloeothece citriformis PCC 7424]
MKLADLYHQVRNKIRYIVSFGRFNPASSSGQQAILHEIRRKAVEASQRVDIPGTNSQSSQSPQPNSFQVNLPWSSPSESGEAISPKASYSPLNHSPAFVKNQELTNDPYYPEYQCKTNDALGCPYPQQTLQQTPQAKFCLGCAFPVPLAQSREIRGRRGIYQIGTLLGKRGMGRLYQGVQTNDPQPIVIKEYLLPNRCFKNLDDVQQRQGTFVRVANLSCADGRDKDFRLLIPTEAIADEQERRCYLITKNNLETLPTLQTYLSTHGSMNEDQVKLLLDQILQTLEFLHGQRFQFDSGQIGNGLVHGNLSLNSILISEVNSQEFFVYLTDLLIWEYLFYRPDVQITPKTINDDLISVGEIGFKMLVGQTTLDPRNDQHWPTLQPEFKQFLLQLLGLEGSFSTATQGRDVLLKLPKPAIKDPSPLKADADIDDPKRKVFTPWILAPAIVVLVAVVGSLLWRTFRKPPIVVEQKNLVSTIEEIIVTVGNFTYSLEEKGAASYIFLTPTLLSSRQSLIDELESRKPGLSLQEIWAQDVQEAETQVTQETANFAIINQVNPSYPNSLHSQPIAYDGLLIFVPFIKDAREQALPKALGGKITFEQVRKLYTGKVQNWKEIGGPDLQVQLYAPTEPSAIQLFEKKVLQDNSSIAIFRDKLKQRDIQEQPTSATIRNLQYEFENEQIAGVSFGFSSQIFGQCGAYPLALQVESDSPLIAFLKRILFLGDDAQQAWIQQSNHQRIDPSTPLCKKGSHQIAQELFQTKQYPLSFPVVVLYPRNNRNEPRYQIGEKFSDMLTTEEGQELLQETNLVPLQPLD